MDVPVGKKIDWKSPVTYDFAALGPGSYVLRIVATDSAGNAGPPLGRDNRSTRLDRHRGRRQHFALCCYFISRLAKCLEKSAQS